MATNRFWKALRLLGRPYQLFCMVYVFIAFQTEAAWIAEAAKSFHVSFGTSNWWPEAYRPALRAVTMTERLWFTFFSVGLLALAVALLFHLTPILAGDHRPMLVRNWFASRRASGIVMVTVVLPELWWVPNQLAQSVVVEGSHFDIQQRAFLATLRAQLDLTFASVLGAIVIAASGRTSVRSVTIGAALLRASTKATYDPWSGLVAGLFPAFLLLWSNHQGEHDAPRPLRGNVARAVAICVGLQVAYFAVDIGVIGFMVSIHVVELVLVWLVACTLGLWLPVTVVTNSSDAIFGLSLATFLAAVAFGVPRHAAARGAGLVLGALLSGGGLGAMLQRAGLPRRVLTHLACIATAPVLVACFAHLAIVDAVIALALGHDALLLGFIVAGACIQGAALRSRRRAAAWSRSIMRLLLVVAFAAVPWSIVATELPGWTVEMRVGCALLVGLAGLGVVVENEADITYHVVKCFVG
jgi:hypothetical protein